MTKEEFCERFLARVELRARAGRKPFDLDPVTYSQKVASIYWEELGKKLSPEQCADLDADYWP